MERAPQTTTNEAIAGAQVLPEASIAAVQAQGRQVAAQAENRWAAHEAKQAAKAKHRAAVDDAIWARVKARG